MKVNNWFKHNKSNVKHIGWIEITDNKRYNFIEIPENKIEKLNGYIIERDDLPLVIEKLCTGFNVTSYVNTRKKSEYLTKIHIMMKDKKLIKSGWEESHNKKGLFKKDINQSIIGDMDVFDDSQIDNVIVINPKSEHISDKELLYNKLDFYIQPIELGSYYPTEHVADFLLEFNIAILYAKRGFADNSIENKLGERDVYFCILSKDMEGYL